MNESEIDRINDSMTTTIMPAIVIVCIYMIVGLIGNPLVIYYYGFRARSTSSFHFILALAVFDLIICCVSMPLEIVDMIHFYKFESAAACKILRFVNYFATIGSGGILIALAVDRYRKICKPLRKQFTLQITRTIIAIVCVFSFCISWPSLVFYNIVSVNITKVPGLTGCDCTMIRDNNYRMLITIYNVVLFLCFIVAVTSLIVLYSLVGRTLFHISCCFSRQYDNSRDPPSRRYSVADSVATEIDRDESKRKSVSYGIEVQIKDEFDNKPLATITELQTVNNNKKNRLSNHFEENNIELSDMSQSTKESVDFDETCYIENDPKSSDEYDNEFNRRSTEIILQDVSSGRTVAKLSKESSNQKKSLKCKEKISRNVSENSLSVAVWSKRQPRKSISKRLNTQQYTVMMIAITIAFIISFLPYLALVTWRTIATTYEVDILSDAELVAFQIFIRSFLISSAVNPMIYGFMNTDFRNFIFRRICCFCFDGPSSSPDISSSHSI